MVIEEEKQPIPAKDISKELSKKNLIQAKKIFQSIENNSFASWNERDEFVFDISHVHQSSIENLVTNQIK